MGRDSLAKTDTCFKDFILGCVNNIKNRETLNTQYTDYYKGTKLVISKYYDEIERLSTIDISIINEIKENLYVLKVQSKNNTKPFIYNDIDDDIILSFESKTIL